jgi:hypothetical protein
MTHMSDMERPTKDRRFDLHGAFAHQEKELAAALKTGEFAGHSGVQGQGTEDRWRGLLSAMLPARYEVGAAIVVDSLGNRSDQLDLVIRDRHFSPLFWNWGGHLYVPAESVYGVFEIKPEINRHYILYTGNKIASVRSLHRTSVSFGWAAGTMQAREQPPILGGILAGGSEWSPAYGDAFMEAMRDIVDSGRLDLGCVLGHGSFEVPFDGTVESVEIGETDKTLITFVLRLLRRLQGLGSAPAIDYAAYAGWISDAPTQHPGEAIG